MNVGIKGTWIVRKSVLVPVVLSVLIAPAGPNDRYHVVLSAMPETLVASSSKGTDRTVLSSEERQESRVTVVKDGESYYWANRDNRELAYNRSGHFHYFTDADGRGIIKVFDPQEAAKDGIIQVSTSTQFFESVSLGLVTYTYWGVVSEFNP